MKISKCICVAVVAALPAYNAIAQSSWKSGTVVDLTSGEGYMLIRLDAGMPDNCAGSPHGWLMIPRKSREIQVLLLTFYTMGKKSGTIYTSGRPDGGYCEVTQWDPYE